MIVPESWLIGILNNNRNVINVRILYTNQLNYFALLLIIFIYIHLHKDYTHIDAEGVILFIIIIANIYIYI